MSRGAWTLLRRSAQDLVRANCRQHRERAVTSIASALSQLDSTGPLEHHNLLTSLAIYALQFEDEDPELDPLLAEARRLGVLPPRKP